MTWYRSARDPRVWVSIDPEDVEEMKSAIEAEWATCGHPLSRGMPEHNTGYAVLTEMTCEARTYQCRSGSRWFNPQTHQMEGHAHCTCDGCF